MLKVREIKRVKFEADLRDGKYEAQSDLTSGGFVEVKKPNGKRVWLQVVDR